MKTKIMPILFCISSLLAGCISTGPQQGKIYNEATGKVSRIGIYDSRAVALTFLRSELFAQTVADLERRNREQDLADLRRRLHPQVLSTASVDNILFYIQDQLPGIAEATGVDLMLSKWDTMQLQNYPTVVKVDITMQLVRLFNPNREQIEEALATMELEPVTLEQAERLQQL